MATLADEAMELCNKLSTAYWRLEHEQREKHWRGIDNSMYLARLERIHRQAADRWRRRVGAKPLYR